MDQAFFPYGTQYHRAPTPLPEEWEQDLAELGRLGYTHVQFRPQWRWHERIRGAYTWDDLDRLFDLAHHNGLRVVLKPMLETAPDWVYDELGGTRIGFDGQPISPIAIGSFYVGGWLPCFDNPEVICSACAFVREMVSRYRNHPALWFYDAWNEPRSKPLGQCQCEHSAESYRRWLGDRYGSIEQLNAKFGKAWSSYESLKPPSSSWDYAEMYLWRKWSVWAVSEQLRQVADAIRQADPEGLVMVHVGMCSVIQDTAGDGSDDILNSRYFDRFGTSFPVSLHPSTPIGHSGADLISDWLRRVDPEYWCHEFYPNHAGWCVPPSPRDLKRIVWLAISGGATGFTYWQYRSERVGNEINGYGLREIDGSPTERSAVADGIADVLKRHGEQLVGTQRVPSSIALVYSRESDLMSRIIVIGPMFAAKEEGGPCPYKQAIAASHAQYLNLGATVDFVTPNDELDRFELVHVTAAEMLSAETADRLRRYVRSGGKLVVEYPFACRDENTWVSPKRPNHGLDELLGCAELSRLGASGQECDTASFTCGGTVKAQWWRTSFELRGAQAIATWPDGSAAATKHRYGDGIVYTLGASLSLSFSDTWDDPAYAVLRWLLDDAGLEQNRIGGDGVWVRRRSLEDAEIWFAFNLLETEKQIDLPALPKQVWEDDGCRLEGLRLSLPPGGTWIAEMHGGRS